MDTLSHYLWAVTIYWQHPKRWLIGLFGALPDLLSFGILTVTHIFQGYHLGNGPPALSSIPSWVFTMYDITHSLVVFALVFALLWWLKQEWSLLTLGWPLHILMDIPSHTTRFFPTPILWPLSDVAFDGMSWAVPWFFITSWVALIAVYVWLIWKVPRTSSASGGGR